VPEAKAPYAPGAHPIWVICARKNMFSHLPPDHGAALPTLATRQHGGNAMIQANRSIQGRLPVPPVALGQTGGNEPSTAASLTRLLDRHAPLAGFFGGATAASSPAPFAEVPLDMSSVSTNSGTAPSGGANTSARSETTGVSPRAGQVDAATVLNGDATMLPGPNDKAPPGVTMEQMMEASGGLLKNLGNQKLQGKGADGIEGGIKDNLAKKVGGKDASDIGTDPDVTWRALQALQAFKNTPASDGRAIPDEIRRNGNVAGLQPNNEVARGSVLGELQDWFKGAIDKPNDRLPKGDGHVTEYGQNTTGAQQAGQKILKFMSDVAGLLGNIIKNTLGKIPGVGKLISAGINATLGAAEKGLAAASEASVGHKEEAKNEAKKIPGSIVGSVVSMVDLTPGNIVADKAEDAVNQSMGVKNPA
jgi:hypothetical protein